MVYGHIDLCGLSNKANRLGQHRHAGQIRQIVTHTQKSCMRHLIQILQNVSRKMSEEYNK